jgi:hypothetical protein
MLCLHLILGLTNNLYTENVRVGMGDSTWIGQGIIIPNCPSLVETLIYLKHNPGPTNDIDSTLTIQLKMMKMMKTVMVMMTATRI